MVSFGEELRVLLWKNWTHRKRNKKRLLIEIVWPLSLFLILMWVRTRGLKYKEKTCHVIEKALPSVGGFEFFQNFMCTLNNTCFDDYVENTDSSRWDDAIILRIIRETQPVLTEIVNSPESRATVTRLWTDITDLLKLISAFQSTEDIKKLGSLQLSELMNSAGKKNFIENVGSYTGLSAEEADEFLNITVHFDKLDQANIDAILTDLTNQTCESNKTYELVTFPNQKTYEWMCKLSRSRLLMLFYLYNANLDRDGVLHKLNIVETGDEISKQGDPTTRFLQYDMETLGKLGQLGRSLMGLGEIFSGFGNLTGVQMASVFVYEGICGARERQNRSAFGVDAGAPNRFDSLRDRLKDWKPDHHYENDPEISAACNTAFQRLESMPISAFMWRQIKPIVRGFIYFAPDTEATRAIMAKVEEKFLQLRDAELTVTSVLQVLHRVRLWMSQNMKYLADVKAFLSKKANIESIFRILGVSVSSADVDRIYDAAESFNTEDVEDVLRRMDFSSEMLSEIVGCVRYNKTRGFPTELQAVNEGHKLLSSEKLWAVIIFSNINDDIDNGSIPAHIYYKIRMDSDKVDGTRAVRDRLTSKGPRRRPLFDLKYITYGFVYLQEMIERSIIELVTGEDLAQEEVYLQQHPYPCYIVDQFIRAVSRTFPLFMVLSWVYASAMIIKSIVLEKELRLREVMKIMGVSNSAVWISWFIESLTIMVISSTVLTLILKYGKVIEFSDPLLIWVFLVSYTVATISFSFWVSTFFSRANSAAAAGGVIFFVSYLPYNMMLIWEEQLQWFETLAGCLISNVAFGFGCTYLARYEQDGIGAQWDKLSWHSLPDDDFNLAYCIAMLWVDSGIYLILTWYTEAVFPGEYGVPKPWNFFLQPSYWKPSRAQKIPENRTHSGNHANSFTRIFSGDNHVDADPEPMDLKCGVNVNNLSKTYPNGKVALDNLSINFYEDQITSFLGHNGAGKTTTISILTGLFPPSKGTAVINNMDIRTDMDGIRSNLGICPQYNVLFDKLTVYEHLQFYSRLKGKKGKDVEGEFTKMLHDLGIPHKRNAYPSSLSGGTKRKLSVCLAFVGGSKTVFLDEPTSGVDPYSRRSIWELLLKYKSGRTVILTTHFMDEADILGDRIAIISQGKLKALGSSLFLKSHFGQGYTLHLVKQENFLSQSSEQRDLKPSNNDDLSKTSKQHDDLLDKFIREVVPNAVLTENVASEIAFLLPYSAVHQFSELFDKLDANLDRLGISSYGISDTSLEDVFLKITAEDLAANIESFHSLSSSCKRRVMELWNQCKNRSKKTAVVTITSPSENFNGTTHTGVSVFPVSSADGDLITGFHKEIDNGSDKSGDSTVTTVFEKKSQDTSYTDVTSNRTDLEGATASLLDETRIRTGSSDGASSRVQRLQNSCPVRCPRFLACVQIYMIIMKRVWNSRRNLKAMFFEIILPALFIAITLAFTLILPPATDEPAREITPWTYPSPNYIFFSEPNRTRLRGTPNEFRMFVNELIGPVGMGTACVADQKSHICDSGKWNNATVFAFNQSRQLFKGAQFSGCSCDIGSLQCSGVQPEFSNLKTQTNDYILDVSNTNIAEWVLNTYDKYMASRYGGYELQLRKPGGAVGQYLQILQNLTTLIPSSSEPFSNQRQDTENTSKKPFKRSHVYKIWYENRGWVSSVAYLNGLHNMWLRDRLPEEYQDRKNQFGITLITHPMNLTKSQNSKESLKTAGLGVIHAICIIFALSFIPASFTVYLIEERKCGGKHMHLVSGVRPITYWIGNFVFDMGKYLIPTLLCLILFKCFDAQAYIGPASFWSFFCLLLLYGWASIPMMYPFSFLFGVPSTAFVVLACSNLFIGVVTTVSTFVLEQFGDEELEAVGKVLQKVFLICPHYCLGRGCIELVKLNVENTALSTLAMHSIEVDRFKWEHLGEKLFYLMLHGICYFLLNLALEYKHLLLLICKLLPSKKRIQGEEDVDVVKERERIETSGDGDSKLKALNLTKYYKRKKYPAVNGITFGIGKGECFGLLGVNGAGKSSTFKMLTGDVRISSGNAKICGADVETNLDSARKHFGYCPQEDSIDPLLSGYELLRLYGRLRGLSSSATELAAKRLIKMLGLSRYADRRSGTYSGGNKRKLSCGIALIGDPDVIFLDEPTSGMDPGARRDLWKVILDLMHSGKTIVLTSHSMEECEVLCTKIAIMVNGQFMCLGSLQHLKNRFGTGYTLTVRCGGEVEGDLLEKLSCDIPSATLEDKHCSQLKFNIPQEAVVLSNIFETLSCYKMDRLIEDYSVSQTTLDDIFVKFACRQKDELDR